MMDSIDQRITRKRKCNWVGATPRAPAENAGVFSFAEIKFFFIKIYWCIMDFELRINTKELYFVAFLKVLGWLFVPYIMIFVRWKRMNTNGRVLGTAWAVLAIIIGLVSNQSGGTSTQVSAPAQTTTPPSAPAASATPSVSSTDAKEKAESDAKAKAAADAKAKQDADAKAKADASAKAQLKSDAEITVSKFDGVEKEYNTVAGLLKEVISGLADGSVDPATASSDLSKLNDQALGVFSDAEQLQIIDRYSDSKETLITSISYMQNGIGKIKDFLDDNKPSTMAEAEDDLSQATKGINLVNVAVATQAIKDGYTPPPSK